MSLRRVGVFVGGTRLDLQGEHLAVDDSRWGRPSSVITAVELNNTQFLCISRHGEQADISPHLINYRANVWALYQAGVEAIIATHTVGSIDPHLQVGQLVLPDQLIDYTWGRAHTFDDQRRHVEFSSPYDAGLREEIAACDADIVRQGVYGCTNGPRLESAAEIRRMAVDGCTLVGMTGMPEAGLARELDIAFASLCVVVNPAAGVAPGPIDVQALTRASRQASTRIASLLQTFSA